MLESLAVPQRTLRIFVSATTQDLGPCRAAVKEELLTAGVFPVTQENFSADYRRLEDFLRLEISRCDAVICLIGFLHGACPAGTRRSFAQLEYDLAIQNDKPVFVFLASDQFEAGPADGQSDEDRESQRRHRELVKAAGSKWELFSGVEDLRLKLARTLQKSLHTTRDMTPRQPIYYRHLPRTPSFFVGRTRELRQLHDALLKPAPGVIVVIGMGGQGKTTLTHKALVDLGAFPFVAGFWCSAYRGGYTFDMFLDDILSYLLKGNLEKPALPSPEERVQLLLKLLQQEPILVVLDGLERWLAGWNVAGAEPHEMETSRDRSGYYAGLDAFLQQASSLMNGSHLVITSRALPSALDNAVRLHIPVHKPEEAELGLEGLELSEAVELLAKLGVAGPPEQLAKVASLYACHPLALTILGTLAKRKWGGRLDRVRPVAVLEPRLELHRLFDEIHASLPGGKLAGTFLGVVSQCLETPSLTVVAAGMPEGATRDEDKLVEVALTLADWSLIWWDGASQTAALHPLAKQYFASLLAPEEAQGIHGRLSLHYRERPVPPSASRLEDVAPLILAIRHAAAAGSVEDAYELLLSPMSGRHSLYTWLSAWGHQACGIDLIGEMLPSAPEDLHGHLLLSRSQFHYQLSKLSAASEDVAQAIHRLGSRRGLGSQEVLPDLAKALATRGSIHCEAGRCLDAIPDLDRAANILENMEQTADVACDLALVVLSRANALRGAGALSRALADYDRACRLWEPLVEEEPARAPSGFAPTLSSRALCLLDLQRPADAVVDLERAVALCTAPQACSREESEFPLAHALATLAIACSRSGQQARAVDCATEAVEILERAVDRGRTDTEYLLGLALIARAETEIKAGRWADASRDGARAVEVYQRLVSQVGKYLEGALAHAWCILGRARYEAGDRDASRDCRRAGLDLWRQLSERWPSESEVVTNYLRDRFQAVTYLLEAADPEGIPVFEALVSECERLADDPGATESVNSELRVGAARLAGLMPKIQAAGWQAAKAEFLLKHLNFSGSVV